ncbi:MAG: GNAT family N-acetyltransferase [Desulfobacterales bacterium]
MTIIERLDREKFASMQEEWNELVAGSTNNNIFLTWEWLSSWWEAFAGKHQFFYFLIARNEQGRLVGAFPFQLVKKRAKRIIPIRVLMTIGRGGGVISNEVEYSTFMMPPILNGYERRVFTALSDYLKTHKYEWDILYFGEMLEKHLTTSCIAYEFQKEFPLTCTYQEDDYVVCLKRTYEDYFQGLSKHERRNFKCKTKKLFQNYDVEISFLKHNDEISTFLNDYFAIVQKRHDWAPSPEKEKFLYLICEKFLKNECLKLYILKLNGQPAATFFTFCHNKKMYGYKAGFDPEYSSCSPGAVLFDQTVKNAISEGIEELDLLIGDYAYKSHWCNEVRKIDSITVYNNKNKISEYKLQANKKLDKLKQIQIVVYQQILEFLIKRHFSQLIPFFKKMNPSRRSDHRHCSVH